MQQPVPSRGMILALLSCVAFVSHLHAQPDDGPFGLRWGMPYEALREMNIATCCVQLGKWGQRYQVAPDSFTSLPKALGDERRMYLYFGQTNRLLRVYVAILKPDATSRFKQLSNLLSQKYSLVKQCIQKKESDCNGYDFLTIYQQEDIEAEIALDKSFKGDDKIYITLLNTSLYNSDEKKKNPFWRDAGTPAVHGGYRRASVHYVFRCNSSSRFANAL